MRNIRLHCAVLSAAMLFSACASGANRGSSAGLESKSVSLSVTNQNWLDVDVYAVRGGSRYRLGAVGGNSSATLRIPAGAMTRGEVQLMADPIGSNDIYMTDVISITPDQQLQLTVAPRMRMSSYAVWVR